MKILSEKEICGLVGVDRSTIRRWERAGQFPKRMNLGPGRIGWAEEEFQEWRDTRKRGIGQGAASFKGKDTAC